MREDRKVLTVAEVAQQLGIGRNLAYEAVRTGEIPAIRVGHRILIPKTAFDEWLTKQPTPGGRCGASQFNI